MVALALSLGELPGHQDMRVDFAAQPVGPTREHLGQRPQPPWPVSIKPASLSTRVSPAQSSRRRTPRNRVVAQERVKPAGKVVRLEHQRAQLTMNGVLRIGTAVDPVTILARGHQADTRKPPQLLLDANKGGTRLPSQLPQVPFRPGANQRAAAGCRP